MRIVYLWDADYPWDVRTEKQCLSMTERGHEVHVVARNRGRRPVREALPEGMVHRMRPWPALGMRLDSVLGFPAFVNPRWASHLARVVAEVRPAVILARDLPLCPLAMAVGRAFGVPVVLDMAENYPAMIRDVWRAGRHRPWDHLVRNPAAVAAVERVCVPRLDRILVVIEESADRLRALGADPARIRIVRNTPPRTRAAGSGRRQAPDPDRPLEVVYLGLMEIPRGIGDLLRAVAALRDRSVEVRLRLIGDGRDLPQLRGLAADLGLDDPWVRFAGFLEHREALALVAAADVGVIPHLATESWNTTIPNKLFDYMAAGLPVVSSDAAPCARILRDTGAGVVYPSGDPRGLAAALESLEDPAEREKHGRAGRAAVRDTFCWERDADTLVRCLEELAERRPAQVPVSV